MKKMNSSKRIFFKRLLLFKEKKKNNNVFKKKIDYDNYYKELLQLLKGNSYILP